MALIGLISDTHGLFDPQLKELFHGVDQILHAGDIGDPAVLQQLEELAPVVAIKGNIDAKYPTKQLPEELTWECEGYRFLLLHDAGRPLSPTPALRRALDKAMPTFVLSGHSHQAKLTPVGEQFFINPGGAGKKRFKLERTAGLMRLSPGRARVEIYSLEKAGRPLFLEGDFSLPKP